jgi:replication factor C large subunit
MMWSEKHRPERLEDMVGNEDARAMVFDWLMNWKRGMKPLLLVGPPGIGKTSLAYAAARQLDYNLIELNASDQRTKGQLSQRLESILYASLLDEKRMLLLDEVDGLFGRADYGGLEYLVEHLEELPIPTLLAANDAESEQVKKLSKRARLVRMKRIPARLAELYLRRVLEKEGKVVPDEEVTRIVDATRGDMRSLLNLAQSVSQAEGAFLSAPVRSYSLKEAITLAASAESITDALFFLQACEGDFDEKLDAAYHSVLASNLEKMRKSQSLRLLAEANLLLRRIRRTQQWRQLRYFDRLLAAALVGTHVTYSEDPLPFQAKLRIWNDSKQLKLFSKMMASRTRVSTAEFSAKHLSSALLILARSEGGLQRWAEDNNLEQSVLNSLQRELKSIISDIGT